MKSLTITPQAAPAGLVLKVSGDLDYTTAQQLRTATHEASPPGGGFVALDLGELRFCDSTGITALIGARNHVVSAGDEFLLVAVPDSMARLLRMTGLDQIIEVRDDVTSLPGN
ncbi:STAS domain-containing protein [Streptomyces sp. NPDC005931]|uniref:STAS domain-containing protein n=1 Tax=Streptomyces sp. NPDC005931 TaxID=3364737 RepID=UPI0036BDC220